jgi:hypothetical protein
VEPGADTETDAGSDAPVDGGAFEGAPSAEAGDGRVCDREPPVVRVGCQETPTAPTITIDRVATPIDGYRCSAGHADTLVRIRACLSLPRDPCVADAGESLCAVVDIPATALLSFPPDGTMRLDGTSSFVLTRMFPYQVNPENVAYTAAQTNSIRRVWMEARCFCSGIDGRSGTQALVGELMISYATDQRVGGRITLSASGHIAPVNYSERHVELDTFFDVAIDAVAQPEAPP